jgi:hypothetical protein
VNRDYYPVPSNDTCATGDLVQIDDDEISTKAIMALAAGKPTDERDAIDNEIKSLTDDKARRNWLHAMSEKMIASALVDEKAIRKRLIKTTGVSAKVLPLPVSSDVITQKLTRAFLRDVNDFFSIAIDKRRCSKARWTASNAGGGPSS